MGDGTQENPYTREDVLRLLKEAEEPDLVPDLSEKVFEEGIDLRGLDLRGIDFSGSRLANAHLEGAKLSSAHFKGADLSRAHLEGADLTFTHFEGANLDLANLKEAWLAWASLDVAKLTGASLRQAWLDRTSFIGAYLLGVEFSPDTKWGNIDWGNYILGEEADGFFGLAEDVYRNLKIWHTQHGLYDIAGKFFYRETEARRKAQSWKKKPLQKLWSWVLRILCGYGEKPERVAISAAVVIFGLAAAYCLWGSFSSSAFADTLYYSVASFTALGYGQWAPQPTGWAKGVGAAEAVLGVSMMALFLVTFTRKMIR
jgi:hypothetical protein